jgi:nucleoside-diphosphate-sugar epimerase
MQGAAGSSGWLLTGCTGLIGRFVLRDLLLQGKDVCVLVRRRGPMSAADRVEPIIQFWERELQQHLIRPTVLDADLLKPNLAIDESELLSINGRFQNVLHCAASVRFEMDQFGKEPLASNIDGTSRLIDFARKVGVKHFHHVSTAYVCGNTQATVFEQPVPTNTNFRNPYEYSKAAAEQLVQAAAGFESKTYYRPSIVIGRHRDGWANAFHTLYAVVRFAREFGLIEEAEIAGIVNELEVDDSITNNVVSVDWVAESITTILNQPNHWNQIFHLTHPEPVLGTEILRAIYNVGKQNIPQWLNIPTVAAPDAGSGEAFLVHLSAYANYFHNDPKFDRTNLDRVPGIKPTPRMDFSALTTAFDFSTKHRFRDTTGPATATADESMLQFCEALSVAAQACLREANLHSNYLRVCIAGVGGGIWYVANPSDIDCNELHIPSWLISRLIDQSIETSEAIDEGLIQCDAATSADAASVIDALLKLHSNSSQTNVNRTSTRTSKHRSIKPSLASVPTAREVSDAN